MNIRAYDLIEKEFIFDGDAEEFLELRDYDEEVENLLCVLETDRSGENTRHRLGDLIIERIVA